jgi:hypothetical protein
MVAVATAMETAAVGAAMTATGVPTTAAGAPTSAPGIGTDGMASVTAAGAATQRTQQHLQQAWQGVPGALGGE